VVWITTIRFKKRTSVPFCWCCACSADLATRCVYRLIFFSLGQSWRERALLFSSLYDVTAAPASLCVALLVPFISHLRPRVYMNCTDGLTTCSLRVWRWMSLFAFPPGLFSLRQIHSFARVARKTTVWRSFDVIVLLRHICMWRPGEPTRALFLAVVCCWSNNTVGYRLRYRCPFRIVAEGSEWMNFVLVLALVSRSQRILDISQHVPHALAATHTVPSPRGVHWWA